MNLVFNRYGIVFLAVLVLSGCASFKPAKVYDGEIKSGKEVATILGQNYREAWDSHVQLFIIKVDGKETYDKVWALEKPNVIQVDPGIHDLEILAAYGNALRSLHHVTSPIIKVHVEAGKVYQIDSRFTVISNGRTGVNYSLRYFGKWEKYEDFLSKHPDYKQGTPLP